MLDGIRFYLETLTSQAYNRATIIVELLIIGTIVYAILRSLHGTRGARLLRGLIVLLILGFLAVRVLAVRFGWDRIYVLYQSFAWSVFLTVLVVFQPELRRGLMRLGEGRWFRQWTKDVDQVIATISTAVALLSKSKIGAIIAIEREVPLGALAENGVPMDAKLSVDLLHTIFWPNSMLHDMGVVVQHDRIVAAGVQFPLAEAGTVDHRLGSRHRAAVGLSLESDALVVVVSEETGTISLADRGRLIRGISPDELARMLRSRMLRPGRPWPPQIFRQVASRRAPSPAPPPSSRPAAPARPPVAAVSHGGQEAEIT